jgi:hypothetical protein
VNGPVNLVALAVLPVGLILFDLIELNISAADTSIPNNEVASILSKTITFSKSGVIMIARTTPSGEGGSNGI